MNKDDEIPDEEEVCFLKKSILDGNYREMQEINQREVHFFDRKKNCLHHSHHRRGPAGHYEKLTRNLHEYIWVPHLKPSGLSNSLVVPGEEVPEEERPIENQQDGDVDDENQEKAPINSIHNMNYLIDKTQNQIN